jgi:hypothetical protein
MRPEIGYSGALYTLQQWSLYLRCRNIGSVRCVFSMICTAMGRPDLK